MIRRLFTAASVVSLVLCLAAAIGFVRSQFVADIYLKTKPGEFYELCSGRGQIAGVVVRNQVGVTVNGRTGYWHEPATGNFSITASGQRQIKQKWGFAYLWWNPKQPKALLLAVLGVPYWALALLFAVVPVWRLRVWRREVRRRRLIKGLLCTSCGYDLRASKDRCPECGSPIQSAGRRTTG
jgi:hypothetical protein